MIRDIDDDRVLERHLALIPVISQYDVIFMQEIIPESWQTIKANMQNYFIINPKNHEGGCSFLRKKVNSW